MADIDKGKLLEFIDSEITKNQENIPSHLLAKADIMNKIYGGINALSILRELINDGEFDKE